MPQNFGGLPEWRRNIPEEALSLVVGKVKDVIKQQIFPIIKSLVNQEPNPKLFVEKYCEVLSIMEINRQKWPKFVQWNAGVDMLEREEINSVGDYVITNTDKKMTFPFMSDERISYSKQYLYKPQILKSQSMPDRNALCTCGSGKKYKKCCGI